MVRILARSALSALSLLLSGAPVEAQGRRQGDIHEVDFRSFNYQTGIGGEKIKVVNGK